MALSTYAGLKASIASWLARSDLTTPIPDFITLAHKALMRDLRGHLRLQKRNASFLITGEYVAVPIDFLELVSLRLTSTDPDSELAFLPESAMTGAYGSGSGVPKFVALVGNTTAGTEQFRFAPVPDGTYTATIEYYASLTEMSADADYNWILTDHPQLYLYGSLLQAAAYIGDDPRIPMWQAAYAEALDAVRREGNRTRYSAKGMMMRAA